MTIATLGVVTKGLLLSARFVSIASSTSLSSSVLRIDLPNGLLGKYSCRAVEPSHPNGPPAHHKRKQEGGPQSIRHWFRYIVHQESDYDRSQRHEHGPLHWTCNYFPYLEPPSKEFRKDKNVNQKTDNASFEKHI